MHSLVRVQLRSLGVALVVLCSSSAYARQPASCPAGLDFIGSLEESTSGIEVKVRPIIYLPSGFTLDTSYQQASPSGSGGRAGSILSSQQIPAGIYIMPGGVGSYGWAVSDPVLTGNRFEMYLYCSMDQAVVNVLHPGCTVWVDVCAKRA